MPTPKEDQPTVEGLMFLVDLYAGLYESAARMNVGNYEQAQVARESVRLSATRLASAQAPAPQEPAEPSTSPLVLYEIATFFRIDYNDLIEVVDSYEKGAKP